MATFTLTAVKGSVSKKDTYLVIGFDEKNILSNHKTQIEKIFDLNLKDELSNFSPAFKAGENFEIPVSANGYKTKVILLIYVGKDVKSSGASIGRKLRGRSETVLVDLKIKSNDLSRLIIAAGLANFQWSQKSERKSSQCHLSIYGITADQIIKARTIIDSVNLARTLIHTPSNIKNPLWLANQATKAVKPLKVKILSGNKLKDFGGLTAVGNSAPKPGPRFVEITYSPKGAKKEVVLVGKGITFDTGGISLKRPYDTMSPMKSDMAGAAACIAVMAGLVRLKPKVKVSALLMLAENSLSATSQRPSDVITQFGGKTVEIINTDAEGRLVLADGLAYADLKLDPDYLIDIATLTGSATLGLSRHVGALYSRDEKLAKKLVEIGETTGDRIWHMPLVDDYKVALESQVADLNHTADAVDFSGGSITAALFLEQFVGNRKWIHLDIAGPARSETDAGEHPKGGTGFGVRLLLEWITTLK
ncbi:MAG: hypothetical protein RL448_277 [Actinomycetota bacterium]|jgi:leucyl aminopeptidase